MPTTIPYVAGPTHVGIIHACDVRPGDLLGGGYRVLDVAYEAGTIEYGVELAITMLDLTTMAVVTDRCGRKTSINRVAGAGGQA